MNSLFFKLKAITSELASCLFWDLFPPWTWHKSKMADMWIWSSVVYFSLFSFNGNIVFFFILDHSSLTFQCMKNAEKSEHTVLYVYLWLLKGSESHLLCPVVFGFCVEELEGSAPCLSQGSEHVPIGCRAEMTETHTFKKTVWTQTTGHENSCTTRSDLRPQVKRRLCWALSLTSFKVSSAFWMWPSDSSSRFLTPRDGGSRLRARRGRHSSVLPPTGEWSW